MKPTASSTEDQSKLMISSPANSGTVRLARERNALTPPVIPAEIRKRTPHKASSMRLRNRLCQKVLRFCTPQARFKAFSTSIRTQDEDQNTIIKQETNTEAPGWAISARFSSTNLREPGKSDKIVCIIV